MRSVSLACATAIAACGGGGALPPGELFQGDQYCCQNLTVGDGYAFFNGPPSASTIRRVPTARGDVADLQTDFVFVATITEVQSTVFGIGVTSGQDGYYFSIPATGGVVTELGTTVYTGGASEPDSIVANGSSIYGIFPRLHDFSPSLEAGDCAWGGVTSQGGVIFAIVPYEPGDKPPATGSQIISIDAGTATRVVLLPGLTMYRVAADDTDIYAAGPSGIVRISRTDSSVTSLGDTEVVDLVDADHVVYALDNTPSIVRYDAGVPTTLLAVDGAETITYPQYVDRIGRIATDGQRLFYSGVGFVRYLDL